MTSIGSHLLIELREEAPGTRRLLERVPQDKLSWKPHEKSRTLGELAAHIAGIPGMAERIINQDEFSPSATRPAGPSTTTEIIETFDRNVRTAEEMLGQMTDERASGTWRLVFMGKEIVKKPRSAALRTNMLNHMYHHRAQLGLYLRLLDVPVPMVYGPTADENPFM